MLSCVLLGDPLGTRAANNDPWSVDTMRIRSLMQAADAHYARWRMDSIAHYGEQALGAIDALLAETSTVADRVRRRMLLEWKAQCLEQLGRAGWEPKQLDQGKQALGIRIELGDALEIAQAREGVGYWYQRNGRTTEALRWYRQALVEFERSGAQRQAADLMNTIGVNYRLTGELGAAMECHMNALQVLEKAGDLKLVAWNHILIGAVHRAKGDERMAIKHFGIARSYYERIEDLSGSAGAYNDLGSAYQAMGAMDSAMYWHQRSAELRRRTGEFNGSGDSYHYMGSILRDQGALDSAMVHFSKALHAYGMVPNKVGMSSVLGSMASLEVLRDRPAEALVHMHKALDLIAGEGHAILRSNAWLRIAHVQTSMGNHRAAFFAYDEAIAIAAKERYHFGLRNCYADLFALHQDRGEPREAYQAHRKYLVAKDSVQRRARKDQVSRLSMRYTIEQLDMAEQVQDAQRRDANRNDLSDQRQQKYLYIAGGSLSVLVAVGLIGRIRFDMRAKRRMEQQRKRLQRAKARAIRGERFKERFLANMSHEIRTPMHAIMGMTGSMRRNEHLPEQKVHLDAIASSADGLLRILNDILDMSKLEAGRLELEVEPMSLRELLRPVSIMLKERANAKGIEASIVIDDTVPDHLVGDANRTLQVVSNLVENGIKFTEKGEVGLRVSMTGTSQDHVEVTFVVHDTGIGIPSDRSEKIFEEFTKVYSDGRHKHGGTGLGLALCKRLAELQGGTLGVVSEVGVGSTFTARIPFAVGVPTMGEHSFQEERSEEHSGAAIRDLRILLAEDNEFNIMVAQDELHDAVPGVSVDVVLNGIEAVALARTNTYDVVLMDVQMPELNGYDATRAIRKLSGTKARVPILAMTANVTRSDIDECMLAGMNGYIPKPFTRKELMEGLATALSSHTDTTA